MKKTKALIILLLASIFAANAQVRSRFEEEIAIGAQGGLNLSQVRFLHNDLTSENELGNIGWNKGASFGISTRFIAQKHFGLQLEFNYLQGGWSESFDEDATAGGLDFANATTQGKISYLSIPLLAHIYFGDTHRFFMNFGPKMGILLDASKENTFTAEQKDYILENNPRDPRLNEEIEENTMDYGICVGGGYECHLKRISILAEVRWTYGLQDVYPHSKKDVYQRSNNQDFSFCLGILFPVAKFHSN